MSRSSNTDWYSEIDSKYLIQSHNPQYGKLHFIKVPFRMLVVGSSGSGKTTIALELIKRTSGTFELIVICCKTKDEPLYKWLDDKINKNKNKKKSDEPDKLIFFENGAIPPITMFKKKSPTLIIFDDLVNEKDQRSIVEYFIRGRKYNISCMYLTQSYSLTPITVRRQCNYIIVKKLSKRDIDTILKLYNPDKESYELYDIYNRATNNPLDFLLIDIDAHSTNKFRKGFVDVLR